MVGHNYEDILAMEQDKRVKEAAKREEEKIDKLIDETWGHVNKDKAKIIAKRRAYIRREGLDMDDPKVRKEYYRRMAHWTMKRMQKKQQERDRGRGAGITEEVIMRRARARIAADQKEQGIEEARAQIHKEQKAREQANTITRAPEKKQQQMETAKTEIKAEPALTKEQLEQERKKKEEFNKILESRASERKAMSKWNKKRKPLSKLLAAKKGKGARGLSQGR